MSVITTGVKNGADGSGDEFRALFVTRLTRYIFVQSWLRIYSSLVFFFTQIPHFSQITAMFNIFFSFSVIIGAF